ncbi:MAG: S49 family peptidase [Chloroflexi bacterium]|nr:S49 family peptidase [Chloroflexota bacterium]
MLTSLRARLTALHPLRWLGRLLLKLGNWRRSFRKLDYILWTLPAEMPVVPESRSWIQKRLLGAPPLSLLELEREFRRIGADPRPRGVVLVLRGLNLSLADLDTLRGSIRRLRERGKRVICYAQMYDNRLYYVASAADEIVMQPGGELMTTGLHSEALFLKDTLDTLGVQLDSVAISPYKGAFDRLTRRDLSPEGREQLDWLLDSQYDSFVRGIAQGRNLTPAAVRALIDTAPHLDTEALAAGYVDAVETEEALFRRLDAKHALTWDKARKVLYRQPRPPADRYVAVLRVAGLMIPGESGSPPVNVPIPIIGGERAGDLTVVRQVRALLKNKNAAAVVLLIDSGGGAAMTAEAMTAALAELAADRPLLGYMNSVAASGGYMIATPARWIMAQPATITGSIGVISAKIVTGGLWDKLRVHRYEFTRGTNACMFSSGAPYTPEQRQRVLQGVKHNYAQFVEHVARSRRMTAEEVDAVSGGRAWTGEQAQVRGLVDELGDIHAAIAKARALANLPDDAPVALVSGKTPPQPPQLAQSPAALLAYLHHNLRVLGDGAPLRLLPFEWRL